MGGCTCTGISFSVRDAPVICNVIIWNEELLGAVHKVRSHNFRDFLSTLVYNMDKSISLYFMLNNYTVPFLYFRQASRQSVTIHGINNCIIKRYPAINVINDGTFKGHPSVNVINDCTFKRHHSLQSNFLDYCRANTEDAIETTLGSVWVHI